MWVDIKNRNQIVKAIFDFTCISSTRFILNAFSSENVFHVCCTHYYNDNKALLQCINKK